MQIAELIDLARARANIESDYRLARMLNVTDQAISAWRNGRKLPSSEHLLRLAAWAELDAGQMLADAQAAKAKTEEERATWQKVSDRLARVVAGLAVTAILSAPTIGAFLNGDNGLESSATTSRAIHYRTLLAWLCRALCTATCKQLQRRTWPTAGKLAAC